MVLKHAQVFGEERLKRGAYLAGLAEGPSLAQDLGLSPKDRLILVEGLDVKTLPFDRIVGLIRKATFPLTLVWSRQRKAGIAATSKGRAASRASREAEGEEREGAGRRNPRVSSTDASEDVAAAGQQQQSI
ncbi:hypothetical protein Esi_0035_0027 [Ectocarpus siliculosus]|uniref:PDZ domain-containing protein n=1 Tax=Ectocarpus siliculosus TaxID=2880 RepID=D7FYS1_ECTSI|nr:hypothetical protein Esi_0035_0027 [Ectocarpus siliculosus]|eukprot:CBJ26563.1 hypothetical protein Esi_0035_0027 [Ectocarpus siliculosus]